MTDEMSAALEQLKLDAMKELAYGASHEINNPLANIAARAQNLMRDESSPERRSSLEAIHQQAMRAHEMIADLMLFARPPALELESVDLREVVQAARDEAEAQLSDNDVRLALRLPDSPCEVSGDRQQLYVVLAALIRNSQEAIASGGTIEISLRVDGDRVVLEVLDNGPGISEEVRVHLFDPFYSGREAGRGLGFGLSKCWRIVTEHGGEILADNLAQSGARITVLLPARQ